MTAEAYCNSVEDQDRSKKAELAAVQVSDNRSPLVNLKKAGLDLVFSPSLAPAAPCLVREGLVEKLGRISEYLSYDNLKLIVNAGWRSADAGRD